MSQPKWKVLWSTDYSRLLEDTTGAYDPELEIAQEYSEDDDRTTKFMLYCISIPKLKLVPKGNKAYLVSDKYDESYPHPIESYEEWFVQGLKKVATSAGMEEMELVDMLTSDDLTQRANGYETISGYYGPENFDSYPQNLTEKQLAKRWK